MTMSSLVAQSLHGLSSNVRRELWAAFKDALGAWHAIIIAIGALALLRGEYTGIPLLLLNGPALWLCKREANDQNRRAACFLVLASWAWRSLVRKAKRCC